MHATLRNNKLYTPARDGEFVTDVDGPGVYEVNTCRERGNVVEFGAGTVEVTEEDLGIAFALDTWGLPVENHRVIALTPS